VSAPSDPTPREGAATPTGLSVPEAALVVAIVLVWASLYPVGKLTFTEITSSQRTFVRATLASAVLLAACADNDAVYCPEHRAQAEDGRLWASYAGSGTTQEAHLSRSALQEPPGPRSWLQGRTDVLRASVASDGRVDAETLVDSHATPPGARLSPSGL
jgi:hypothetical protein